MTSAPDDLRLAADFAPASYDDWRKLVDGVLKGAPFEKLVGKTYDGLRVEPIYPRARGAAPITGRAPAAPWQITQRIDHPDAAMANAQALHDLENGASALEIDFAGGPGARGFGVHDATTETLTRIARWPVLLVVLLIGLAVLYRYGPDRRAARWQWVSVGSVFAAVTWIAASFLFSWYLASFANYNATYGSLGAVVGLMIWLWISTILVLLGAELNAEIEHQTARDSTVGDEKPLGVRGAVMADTVGAKQT